MARFDGSLARKLDFGGWTTTTFQAGRTARPALRLAPRGQQLAGPDKYKVLAHRRHQAQINARRVLDLCDA
ncbi:MAG TPA: hypothetical protein VFJ02_04220 [Vicinamibacterales bacterium]|nr:hypothetical protein [Vicinamibacterales bacterium]